MSIPFAASKTGHFVDWRAETERIIRLLKDSGALMAYIDLFCGAGGTSSGVKDAEYMRRQMAMVIVGINHDDIAIAAHKVNHPETLHLVEDIREVRLKPIKEMIRAIRQELPYIKIVIWMSAECTHHSKAKGGDSRDADSRSLAEELYRYERAIHPDLTQVENVVDFRTWGPTEQKTIDVRSIDLQSWKYHSDSEYGMLFSKDQKAWSDWDGKLYKKDKKKGIIPHMVPIKSRKCEYFNEWVAYFKNKGYRYEDRDINSADIGAYTSRIRYFAQMSKKMEILWPQLTHAKDPDKVLKKTGKRLKKHKAVKVLLDFDDTGDSFLLPGRIKSSASFNRVFQGAVKFIAGGKKAYEKAKADYLSGVAAQYPDIHDDGFLIKWNSSKPDKNEYHHSVSGMDQPAPAVPCRNMFGKTAVQFMPFVAQLQGKSKGVSIEGPLNTVCGNPNFAPVTFLQSANNGFDAQSMNYSIENPARTVTSRGTQQIIKILPFICNYYSTGTNWKSIDEPAPTIMTADIHSLISPQPFITRDFSGGGQFSSVEDPAGAAMPVPKMNLVQTQPWIMETSYNNIGRSIDEPAPPLLASRRHAIIVNPAWFDSKGSSVELPCPTVVAKQEKVPLHLCQFICGDEQFYGIVIYADDLPIVRELKLFMAIYRIIDIKMRMLKESELLPIQGLPVDYFEKVRRTGINVTATNAKKYIGNAVEKNTAQVLVEVYGPSLAKEIQKFKKAA